MSTLSSISLSAGVSNSTFGSQLRDTVYADSHILRKQSSTMDAVQLSEFVKVLKRFPFDRCLDILSIGSGTGDFDRDLIQALKGRVRRYICVEPLHDHIEPLRRNLSSVLRPDQYEVHHTTAEELTDDRRYDVIHNVHVIHWMKDPVGVLRKCRQMLREDGISVTVLQSERGMPRIYSKLKPQMMGTLTAESLTHSLKRIGLRPHLTYVPAELDATSIIQGEEIGKRILEFIISAELTQDQYREAIPFVQTFSVKRVDRHFIPEPFAFIITQGSKKEVG